MSLPDEAEQRAPKCEMVADTGGAKGPPSASVAEQWEPIVPSSPQDCADAKEVKEHKSGQPAARTEVSQEEKRMSMQGSPSRVHVSVRAQSAGVRAPVVDDRSTVALQSRELKFRVKESLVHGRSDVQNLLEQYTRSVLRSSQSTEYARRGYHFRPSDPWHPSLTSPHPVDVRTPARRGATKRTRPTTAPPGRAATVRHSTQGQP